MALDAGSVAGDKAVVEFLVVGEIEALGLEFGFQAPIGFGEKEEGGVEGFDGRDGVGPETVDSRWWMVDRNGKPGPGLGEDFGKNEHGHVAADAIATVGDGVEHFEHFGVGLGTAVIELDGIGPSREVWVFAVGEEAEAVMGLTKE